MRVYIDLTSCNEALKMIKEWLVQGTPNAQNLVDFPWEVEAIDKNTLKAVHPRFPIEIDILCSDEAKSIRATILTPLETINLDNASRVKLYRKLLRLNNMPLAKYMLYGDEDSIGVAVDLSTFTLGKKEFNDALAFLISGLVTVAKEFGVEETIYMEMAEELAKLVARHFEEGWSRDKLIDYLVNIVGMKKEEAEEFLRNIGIKPGKTRGLGVTPTM